MPRIRLRSMLISVAMIGMVLGIGTGLKRRSDRQFQLGLKYSAASHRVENLLFYGRPENSQVNPLFGFVHWNDAVASEYYKYSSKPWLVGQPDPSNIICKCSACMANKRIVRFGKGYGNETIPEVARNRQ